MATAPQRKTQRLRPPSTEDSSSGFPVNRHHVSNSDPTLSSSPTTATRAPGRLQRKRAINSGKRPEAKVFPAISRSRSAFIGLRVYCAFVQVFEPVNLTDTSEIQICRGLPSAVPRCSVEISRGPAFLCPVHDALTRLGFLSPPW